MDPILKQILKSLKESLPLVDWDNETMESIWENYVGYQLMAEMDMTPVQLRELDEMEEED